MSSQQLVFVSAREEGGFSIELATENKCYHFSEGTYADYEGHIAVWQQAISDTLVEDSIRAMLPKSKQNHASALRLYAIMSNKKEKLNELFGITRHRNLVEIWNKAAEEGKDFAEFCAVLKARWMADIEVQRRDWILMRPQFLAPKNSPSPSTAEKQATTVETFVSYEDSTDEMRQMRAASTPPPVPQKRAREEDTEIELPSKKQMRESPSKDLVATPADSGYTSGDVADDGWGDLFGDDEPTGQPEDKVDEIEADQIIEESTEIGEDVETDVEDAPGTAVHDDSRELSGPSGIEDAVEGTGRRDDSDDESDYDEETVIPSVLREATLKRSREPDPEEVDASPKKARLDVDGKFLTNTNQKLRSNFFLALAAPFEEAEARIAAQKAAWKAVDDEHSHTKKQNATSAPVTPLPPNEGHPVQDGDMADDDDNAELAAQLEAAMMEPEADDGVEMLSTTTVKSRAQPTSRACKTCKQPGHIASNKRCPMYEKYQRAKKAKNAIPTSNVPVEGSSIFDSLDVHQHRNDLRPGETALERMGLNKPGTALDPAPHGLASTTPASPAVQQVHAIAATSDSNVFAPASGIPVSQFAPTSNEVSNAAVATSQLPTLTYHEKYLAREKEYDLALEIFQAGYKRHQDAVVAATVQSTNMGFKGRALTARVEQDSHVRELATRLEELRTRLHEAKKLKKSALMERDCKDPEYNAKTNEVANNFFAKLRSSKAALARREIYAKADEERKRKAKEDQRLAAEAQQERERLERERAQTRQHNLKDLKKASLVDLTDDTELRHEPPASLPAPTSIVIPIQDPATGTVRGLAFPSQQAADMWLEARHRYQQQRQAAQVQMRLNAQAQMRLNAQAQMRLNAQAQLGVNAQLTPSSQTMGQHSGHALDANLYLNQVSSTASGVSQRLTTVPVQPRSGYANGQQMMMGLVPPQQRQQVPHQRVYVREVGIQAVPRQPGQQYVGAYGAQTHSAFQPTEQGPNPSWRPNVGGEADANLWNYPSKNGYDL